MTNDELLTKTGRLSGDVPNIVIIGGGFAGLEAARRLAGARAHVTLIDKKNHHCFQPLLYQVATASLASPDVAWPIRSILATQDNVDVVMNEVTAVDRLRRVASCADGQRFPFDYLVIATGATHSYFGHPEWEKFAPGLKTIEDATRIRSRMLSAFEKAEAAASPAEKAELMTFVIIGGGPTGVEMAGSIADLARNILGGEFRHIDPAQARIILIEAGPRLLGAFPERLSRYAGDVLGKMGVEIIVGNAVTVCEARGVTLGDGTRLNVGFTFWAAGVRASPASEWLGLTGDRAGRVPVTDRLEVADAERIFVIGDTASVVDKGGQPVPGIAPAAKQMGAYVGRLIAGDIAGQKTAPFVYRHQGDLAAIGRAAAIVKLNRMELTGFVAWLFWGVAHIYFLIERRSRLLVAVNWLAEYVMRKRGSRIISVDTDPGNSKRPA
jgi:NADH dehydrogenase